jgi:CRP/FNR family transcriptional activator FtrB
MIAPEMLQKASFFDFLTPTQQQAIALISKEKTYQSGDYIFREKDRAQFLCILVQGKVDLFFTVEVEYHPELRKELFFHVIGPGELFGISALIEPHILTSSARASELCQVIQIDMDGLLALCEQNERFGLNLMDQVARTTIERVNAARLQLATVWSTEQG